MNSKLKIFAEFILLVLLLCFYNGCKRQTSRQETSPSNANVPVSSPAPSASPESKASAYGWTLQDNQRARLSDYLGKVVVLDFYATWCEPCRDEMASMQRLQQQLAGRPFKILLVNYGESRARVGEFVKREAVGLPILLDPNQDAPRAWRVRVLPSSFLVGPDGRVRYSVIGEIDWAGVEAVNLVRGLLP